MAKNHAPRFLTLVSAARAGIREVGINEIKARLDRGDTFHLLDVREDNEWNNGHLPGATHLGKGIIERDIEKIVPDTTSEIVLYCGGGYRSALAAEALQKMGYSNVVSMIGGFGEWKTAGYTVEDE